MKGYKAFNKDLTCLDMQYEIGKEYEMSESPIICDRGYHFCKNILDVYKYYDIEEDTRVCEVEAYGEIVSDDDVKFCTNKIRIIREIENPMEVTNAGANNSGIGNAGRSNLGDRNSGYCNIGDDNSGYYNRGCTNSGDYNSGDFNAGCNNYGSANTGSFNIGCYNSGSYNMGDGNSGYCNSGDHNLGDWNFGRYNIGLFNTDENPKIKMFDADSDWTFEDWEKSAARRIMYTCPHSANSYLIDKEKMSDEEKELYPEYKIIGGCTKLYIAKDSDKQAWWDNLSDSDKQIIFDLPNFNAEKFKVCTGIDVSKK